MSGISDDIIVTLPKSIPWETYLKELQQAEKDDLILNFKVPFFPKKEVERCYIVHDGKVRGWQQIYGYETTAFKCETTGKRWTGKFIQRRGKFFPTVIATPFKGFQGWRYFKTMEDI